MKIEQWHRRHALCIAGQLPDGPDDALAVLECVRGLAVTFLHADIPEPEKAPVVMLRAVPDLIA